jgi:hypothetical protein
MEWRKSSYSGGTGGNCVEVAVTWHKSSYSSGHNPNCVEVAETPHAVHVRDSRHPTHGHLTLPTAEWRAFLTAVKHREL